jgi:uracil phosphoribosyltransferase
MSVTTENLVVVDHPLVQHKLGLLATGNSTAAAVATAKGAGAQSIRLIAIIAAPEGIERIQAEHPDVAIVVAAVDRELNDKGYIVPGLGDAGDRLYGTK